MPRASLSPGGLDPQEELAIRREVGAFVATHHFRWNDKDDLFQECALRWLSQRDRYTSERGAGRTTFLKRVVGSALIDVLRSEGAEGRTGARTAASLDEPLDDAGLTLAEVVPGPSPLADSETALDLAPARLRLSPRQQRVLQGVLAGYGRGELADRLGIHRDTLGQDLRRIRAVLRDEGLSR